MRDTIEELEILNALELIHAQPASNPRDYWHVDAYIAICGFKKPKQKIPRNPPHPILKTWNCLPVDACIAFCGLKTTLKSAP